MMRCPDRCLPRFSRAAALVALLLASGCATVLAPGEAMVAYDKGGAIEARVAPSDGTYALYSKYGQTQAMHQVGLVRGDPLGFKTAETGKVIAVAGDHEWTMTDTSYVWNRLEP